MSNRKSDRNNLAIIGSSGTGKTTLAVGLYATSTESFTVSPDGDETRKYLEIRKTSIEEGFWPAATNESENFDLRLRLHVSGRQMDIVFREYMGERMERDPNYIRAVIGTPKSAMILFNPGMPGLSKPETRNRMLGNLKVIVQHLKDNGCIAIAFVVTASDRLTSDLAAFREDFEAYASEVTNHLTNLGLEWKRFDVTVSGQLDDQNKPKLARGENNTTHEPFLWLLKRIRDCKRRKSFLTAAAVVAIILGVSGTVFGGLVIHSRQVLARAETTFTNTTNALNIAYAELDEFKVRTESESLTNGFDNITAILPSDRTRKQALIDRAKEQNDLWGVRLLRMEFTSNRNKIATRPLDVPLVWFEDFNKRLTASGPVFRDAVIERDTLTNEWTKSRSTVETNCQTEHFRANVEQERKNLSAKPDALREPLLNSKKLITDEEKKYSLVTNRTELCVRLGLMTARTNAIASFVDSKMGKREDPNPPDDTMKLRQQISTELKSVLTSEEFDKLPAVISQRHAVTRMKWEEHNFPLRLTAIEKALKGAVANPSDPLRNSLEFLGEMDELFSSISEDRRSAARDSITNERTAAISRYLDLKTPWKQEDKDPPLDTAALENQARQELISALTDEEFKGLLKELAKRCATAREAWDAYHFLPRVRELETALNGAGSNPTAPLKDSLAFLDAMTNNYPTISTVKFINARRAIEAARKKALTAYANSIAGEWKVNGSKPPEFDAEKIRNTILTESVVTDKEYQAFYSGMNTRFVTVQQEWNARQKKLVEEFSVEGDPERIISKYQEFFYEHSKNPFLSELTAKVDQTLQGYFRDFIRNYYCKDDMNETQRRFNKFRRVCAAFDGNGLVGNSILLTPSGKFAMLCNIRGKLNDLSRGIYSVFDQKIRISKIEANLRVSRCSDNYKGLDMAVTLFNLRWNFEQKDFETVSPSSVIAMKEAHNSNGSGRIPRYLEDSWQPIWTDSPEEISFGPYTTPIMKVSYEDRLDGWVSDDVKDYEFTSIPFVTRRMQFNVAFRADSV